MKSFLSIIFTIFISSLLFGQSPNRLSYQAVVRNSTNNLVVNQTVSLRISIISGSTNGNVEFVETHNTKTNANGLISIEIGGGSAVSGNLDGIKWGESNHFLKTEIDPNGGSNYTITGTSQFLSVPYSFYSNISDSIRGKNIVEKIPSETDPVFNGSVASKIFNTDTSNWNNKQDKLVSGNNISIINDTLNAIIIEQDPLFNSSISSKITSLDTLKWNNKQETLTPGKGISIKSNTISTTTGFSHYVGEYFEGGVIYYLWKDSLNIEHGLIVDLNNLSSSQIWSNASARIGSSAQSTWDGESNCQAIVNQTGHNNSAALLCLNSRNSGYNDWYLPSIDELNLLWQNRFIINKSLSKIAGASQFLSSSSSIHYWSSTELTTDVAYKLGFLYGEINNSSSSNRKDASWQVRAIRKF